MTVDIKCACGKRLRVKQEHAGKRVKCPACQAEVRIPERNGTASASKSQVKAASSNAASNRSPESASKSERGPQSAPGVANSSAGAETSSPVNPIADLLDEIGFKAAKTRNSCPQCKSILADEAVLCVHCGYHLERGKALKTKRVGRL